MRIALVTVLLGTLLTLGEGRSSGQFSHLTILKTKMQRQQQRQQRRLKESGQLYQGGRLHEVS